MSDDRQEASRRALELAKAAPRPTTLENNLYAKWINMPHRTTSMRAAINAMCAHCMGCNADHMEPGYKNDIKNCQSTMCPLWHFRPYKEKS